MAAPREICADYLSIVDERAPGLVEGLYLVGSLALDDFRPGLSDIDFVAVTGAPVDPEVARPVHAYLASDPRPAPDGSACTSIASTSAGRSGIHAGRRWTSSTS